MEAQHVLDLEQPFVEVTHLCPQLLGVAIEGDTGLVECLELQAVGPLPYLNDLVECLDGLGELQS